MNLDNVYHAILENKGIDRCKIHNDLHFDMDKCFYNFLPNFLLKKKKHKTFELLRSTYKYVEFPYEFNATIFLWNE